MQKLIESQAIGLPAAGAIITFVGAACIWLEHRFTRIEDRIDKMPCQNCGLAERARKKKR